MKKFLSLVMAVLFLFSVTACGSSGKTSVLPDDREETSDHVETKIPEAPADKEVQNEDDEEDFRIGIVTGSFSQSEDDRRGAEAFQEKYGSDKVTLAIYPDNFTDEFETTL